MSTKYPELPEQTTHQLRAGRQAVADRDRKVIVISGGLSGEVKTARFDKDRIVLGSVVSADVRLVGDGVAPIHAVIELSLGEAGAEATIYDLASETGVFVNGAKVITQMLSSGDHITIGRAKLTFGIENRDEAATLAGHERVRWTEGRSLFLSPDEDFKSLLLEEHADPIFDYRPSHKKALEVVMSWHSTVLDIEHFVHERAVTVGATRGSHFGIPPLLSAANYPIITRAGSGSSVREGEDFVLNLDRQMKGVIFRKGKLMGMSELLESSVKGEHGYQFPLAQEDFAKITIGEIDFFFSFTAAPPRLKRGRLFDRDVLFYKIFSASIVLTALMLYGLTSMRVVPTLDAEQIPERLATILYAPEKYAHRPVERPAPPKELDRDKPRDVKPVPPKPAPVPTTKVEIKPNPNLDKKPIPKEMDTGAKSTTTPKPTKKASSSKGQGAAKEGQGARHSGTEGTRGKKNAAANKSHQDRAKTPSPEGGKGPGSSNSQTQDFGNVDFLKGAQGKIENILSGAGAHLGKGGETLKGLGGFDTRGNGGLALAGNGKGGGGTSDLSQGLSDKGRGMGRVGTGLGAAGHGNGIIGGQARVAIRSGGSEETVVMGSIDADAIDAAIRAHADEFRNCYEREINAEHPALAGRIGTTFVIGSGGRVTEAGVESSTLGNANVERCTIAVIKRIDFPAPRGGGVVQVKYPFKYSPIK